MSIYQKLKYVWKKLGIKGQVKNFSSLSLWVLETETGPPIAHRLLPMMKSPNSIDADAFRRTDNKAIEGHKSWWKIYDFSTAEIFDEKNSVRVSSITKTRVNDKEFGDTLIVYDESSWGVPVKLITDVRRNKKKEITRYHVTGLGWLSPLEALSLVCHGEIDNGRPVFPKKGKPFIRTRRDQELLNNLEVKA